MTKLTYPQRELLVELLGDGHRIVITNGTGYHIYKPVRFSASESVKAVRGPTVEKLKKEGLLERVNSYVELGRQKEIYKLSDDGRKLLRGDL